MVIGAILVALPASAAQSAFVPNAAAIAGVTNVAVDTITGGPSEELASRLAYETSDTDTLLPRLSSFFPPGQFFGSSIFELGNTTYRSDLSPSWIACTWC